ncbi:myosin heavy chain, muscle-like isoform X2 [Tigriopus californicus]|uniref:myosin heavy chain, muscle-like isoform X2 n=1 Tax=Tigriopus californicus TaxID=6832 RepID=UPI0027DAA9FB|nr:myosin heavy chain, muscle-like isoform X2 [Tigriopus californicus]
MPGHVKRGGTGEPDPDPTPFLFVSFEQKQKDMSKPYDPKRSCWVSMKEGGFQEGSIESAEGDKVTVRVGKDERKVLKKDQVQQVNPPKFERCEDMSNLTYLNDASVLHNLKARYISKLIYTYSGLFCVAVNPYKRFPIYTETAIRMYINKRRNEMPPHIFAIADGAYQSMLTQNKNQSILITGESGAGKTENTKKVIGYFACVGATGKSMEGKASLEDRIVQTNPILEAFGNAKTVRNDNSSRFGKFIRIHFNQAGKLSGADMEVYLLEKSRITFQQPLERCYHIFYNIMSDAVSDLKKTCLLSNNIKDYHYVSQGKVSVESIDDKEDMQFADEAFDILGFTKEEKYNVYRVTAVVMHLGEMKFKTKSSKDDQAVADESEAGGRVATLLGIDADTLYENFCRPKIKVGSEWVTKGQNMDQAHSAVSGIARAIFERQFRFLVSKCNDTLVDPTMRKISFIGVLDIAGFEIFDYNGFEQMCINFCNEKLQQFFNHHMFVLEQEEYMREGIEWAMVDFGMDLQKCIDMFEKPMGLLSILEEESLFPKATDKTFEEKLMVNHLGKSPTFQKPKPGGPDKNAHFAIVHYAGTVAYNLTNWLEKNKDPLNDTVVDQMKNASNKLIVEIFREHPGQSGDGEDAKSSGGKKKKGGGKTVSSFYKEQLSNLMTTLHATEPHFIRCVVPNTHKQPGEIDSPLVMHQLTCNGVLEGIRICRKGFPNRMVYSDFKARYNILAAEVVARAKNDKMAAKGLFDIVGLESEKYRLGHTKVFFRAGVLGMMEEIREEKISKILSWLQATARGKLARIAYKKLQEQKLALYCVQRTIRNFMVGKTWLWWQLWLLIKPHLRSSKFAEIKATLEEKRQEAEKKIEGAKVNRQKANVLNQRLMAEKDELEEQLAKGDEAVRELEDKAKKMENEKKEVERQAMQIARQLAEEEEACQTIANATKKLDSEVKKFREEVQNMEEKLSQAEEDKVTKDSQIGALQEELQHQEELVAKLQKEKRSFGDSRQKVEEDLQAAEDKANHLNRLKVKLEQNLDEMEDSVEREKKSRNDVEKVKRKLEGDLRCTQETLSDLERNKNEVSQVIARKDKELQALAAKIEDEQALGGKMHKQTKELSNRLEELEEELEIERNNRSKAEKTRQILSRELEELGEKLEESGNATAAQIELNRKRETELAKLKDDYDNGALQHETVLANLRQKHNAVIADLGDQIDQINKAKSKAEQQKNGLIMEMNDTRRAVEELTMDKANIEKMNKCLQGDISDGSMRLEDLQQALNDADGQKKRLAIEKDDMEKQIEDAENQLRSLGKLKTSLSTQLDDTRRLAEAEARDRANLLGKFRNLEADLESIREKIDLENEAKAEIQKAMARASAEAQVWKGKFTTEALARIDDLDNARAKLLARIEEAEECIDGLNSKVGTTEKLKNRYQIELEDLQMEFERINGQVAVADKKLRTFDKVVGEWKMKCDDLSTELDSSHRECRNQSSELFRLRAAWDETVEQLDTVRRENKNLADEIKDLLDQLGEGGRSIHELDKQRKRLQVEKDELQAALEEAESALEQEENKVLRAQLEVGQVRQEIERRLQEKEEDFENTKKNFMRAIDSMQASLEGEVKAKEEALRIKKKIEADINELEMALDHSNKANAEDIKQIKRHAATLLEVDTACEEEARARSELEDQAGIADRKANVLTSELDEARLLLDTADRARRNLEGDVGETRSNISELTNVNSMLTVEKRRLEGDLRGMQAELDNLMLQVKNAEEKARKAMIDAGRLADELRNEQDHGMSANKAAKALQSQSMELQARLDEVEENAIRHGKKVLAKLEERVRNLEDELGTTQIRSGETHKHAIKADRRIKEMQFTSDENRKNMDHMSDLVDKLQGKIRTYKKQIEDAEEIAALNLAKFRKAQQQMEDAEERTRNAEGQIDRLRHERGASMLR